MRVPVPLLLSSVAAVAAFASSASAQTAPARKAGWWEMTMQMSAPVPMTQKMNTCTDPATEKANGAFTNNMDARSNCTQGPVTRTPAGWSFSSTCKAGEMTMTTSGTARGDFGAGYHVEAVTRMNPAPMPQMAETRMVIDGKWMGPCPAGRKPGSVWR
jgi:hypothetical protein